MSDPSRFWRPRTPDDLFDPAPPAAEADVRAWEERNNVPLPATLSSALMIQDGGVVRGSDLHLEPLGRITPLSDPMWAHVEGPVEADRSRQFVVGTCWGVGIVLDYNQGLEPTVLLIDFGMGGELRDDGHGTFDQFLRSVVRAPGASGEEAPSAS